jgi:hypothetical protein
MEGTEMRTARSRITLNDFHRRSLTSNATYIEPRIVHKLKVLNASVNFKLHTFRATVPGYYVEWFYNANTETYTMISGAVNGMVYLDEGDLDKLCDEFERMFGYDV